MLQSHKSIFDPGILHKNCLTNFVHYSGMVILLPLYRVQLLGMVIPRTASIVPLPLYRFQHKPQIPQKKMFDKPTKAVYHTSMKPLTPPGKSYSLWLRPFLIELNYARTWWWAYDQKTTRSYHICSATFNSDPRGKCLQLIVGPLKLVIGK